MATLSELLVLHNAPCGTRAGGPFRFDDAFTDTQWDHPDRRPVRVDCIGTGMAQQTIIGEQEPSNSASEYEGQRRTQKAVLR